MWALPKTIVCALLITCTLSSSFLVPLIYLDFEVRKEYIERVLCIEREKPISVCKGSCYLNEQLALAKSQTDSSEKQGMTPIDITFFFTDPTLFLDDDFSGISIPLGKTFTYPSDYTSFIPGVFQPPTLA